LNKEDTVSTKTGGYSHKKVENKEHHILAPVVPIKKEIDSHKGLPKVVAHHNLDKDKLLANRIKVRDYRVQSASVRTAGLAKKDKVKLEKHDEDTNEKELKQIRDSISIQSQSDQHLDF
jgi:hypothetical protein